MKKTVVGITIVGKDREGVVAAFTNFAFSQGGNIEKVNQNVIKGLFGMYLEVSFSKLVDVERFDIEIQGLARKEKMDVSIHHETNLQKNIAVLVTKEPLCLETIIANSKSLKGKIAVIIGTEKTLEPLAKKANIPFVLVEEKIQQDAESKIIQTCKKYDVDLISLARYMRILSPNFVWRYPNRIINIHPSLLPAFPGASAYAQAYERGTKIVGVTSHYVTENLDQGPIIFQDSFNVDPNDTLEKMKAKGQKLEANMLLKAMKMHLENKLEVRWRKVHIKSK
ncbi:formyltetrahydrofolate deformylase [archaeon]|nr:formyltetrahydrofolate deformylase [archaeon]